MIQSMTGFAIKTWILTTENGSYAHIICNIKSFNSRFFETTCKLPVSLSYLENDIIQLLKKKLVRGHIYLTIQMDNSALFKGNVQPSINVIDGYIDAIKKIQQHLMIPLTPPSIEQLLRLPDIFTVEENSIDEKTAQKIMDEIEILTTHVIKTRNEEGSALKKDLIERSLIMQQEVNQIAIALEKIITQQKDKIQRMNMEGTDNDAAMTDQRKIALYTALDKMDIHEELVRFQGHLNTISEQLSSSATEKGKRLDFTLQELGREANTMSAKCSDLTISRHIINIKVEIEKIREQIQNIV